MRQGEPTVLAILETLAAMAASVWIGIHFVTWVHVVVGATIAPFLLLRTDESCRRALRWVDNGGVERRKRLGEAARQWVFVAGTVWTAAVDGPLIRFGATLAEIPCGYRRMIGAIPGNWWRAVVATDLVESPEFLPVPVDASSNDAEGDRYFRVYWVLSEAFKRERLDPALFVVCLFPFILIPFAYRFSLKSTALVWFPLLWALRPVKRVDLDWRKHFEIGAELGKTRFVGAFSAGCLILLVAKYVLWTGRHELALNAEAWRDLLRSWNPALADSVLADGLIAYVRPGAFPPWQVATLLNSLLGLFVWWKVRTWLAHFRHDTPPSDDSITRTLAVTFFFRRPLTFYLIVCNGFMAFQLARRLPVPEIGWKLFPWV